MMSGGYRKPPQSSQFKKGQSGNPKGRPKRSEPLSTAYIFRKVANEAVEVETEYGKQVMTRLEALVRMLQNRAINKDPGAARLLHQMRKSFPGSPAAGDAFIRIVYEEDLNL
jgi:hypothetical protein